MHPNGNVCIERSRLAVEKTEITKRFEKLIEERRLNLISSSMIAYVGFAFMLLVLLSSYFEIPKAYIIGATTSSFFFVLADYAYTIRPINKRVRFMYKSTIFLGVFSFIVLPVILMSSESLNAYFQKESDKMTLFGLGLILVLINNRILDKKSNVEEVYRELTNKAIEQSESLLEMMEKYMDLTEGLQTRIEETENNEQHLNDRIKSVEEKL